MNNKSGSVTPLRLTIQMLLLVISTQMFAQQLPFHGTPFNIPGSIEAEDFDLGGEGVAYHDTDLGNSGGQYRETDVDIENCSIGGYDIGYIVPGEWLEYTVEVENSGLFSIELSVASPSGGGTVHVEFDGEDVSGPITFEASGGWQTWSTISIDDIQLTAGQQVMRVVSDAGAFNLNSYNFGSLVIPNPPLVEITSPLDNTDYFHGDDIQLTAAASDSNGTIELVEFFADDEKIGEDSSEPYEYFWLQPDIGKYDLIAVATDNDGARGTSRKVDISVNFPEYDYSVNFSAANQFPETAFYLEVSTGLGGSEIRYTLDGSNPLTSNSVQSAPAPVQIYIDPQSGIGGRGVTPGVTVRAVVFDGSLQQSRIATKTYLFIQDVKTQDYPGGDWPDWHVNDQIIDYSVNAEVVNDPAYSGSIDEALLDIPSISLVTDLDNLFDSENGIYVNAEFHGRDWERPVSVELLNPDGSPGFQIDAGLRMRGGWSRHGYFPKHSFRLFFREAYGENKLRFPLFGEEGVDEFKKVDLRTSQNYAWSNGGIWENTMNRDVFSRDLQAAMGQPYTRSRYYHLYLNGMYWGLFQTQERPEANFAESYLGDNDDDYDVVKVDVGEDWNLYEIEATDGNLDAWEDVWDASEAGFNATENYFALEGRLPNGEVDQSATKLVDIDNLIDYMMIIFYTGNFDGPVSKFRGEASPNNFYAIYNRNANDGFIFLTHDSEHTLLVNPHPPGVGIDEDRVNIYPYVGSFETFHPQWLHVKLAENEEYRMRFADHIYRHFNNDGVMQPESLTQLFAQSANDIDMAIIGESMRWGDLQRSKFNAWQPAIDLIVNDYFPQRGGIVLDQFRTANLYPDLDPPLFKIEGVEYTEGILSIQGEINIELEIQNQNPGSIIYSLDGTDPRAIGGSFSQTALVAENQQVINIDATSKLMARLHYGDQWSALHEITIHNNDDLSPLTLSEIHYHPLDEGEASGKYYEFLEFYNSAAYALNLSLLSFSNGIDYTFPTGTFIEAGHFLVIASNATSFQERYDFEPFGEFTGQLDNSGEKLAMATVGGDTIISLRYDDHLPWPEAADGDGPSLIWTNQTENGDLNDAANWSVSENIHGSPGVAEPTAIIPRDNLPISHSLSQNFPNPFNPTTTIRYGIAAPAEVSLTIFDIRGTEIKTIASETNSAGWYEQVWDGVDNSGYPVATGLYFARLKAGSYAKTIKMMYLK